MVTGTVYTACVSSCESSSVACLFDINLLQRYYKYYLAY
jgi:hypothetical protein